MYFIVFSTGLKFFAPLTPPVVAPEVVFRLHYLAIAGYGTAHVSWFHATLFYVRTTRKMFIYNVETFMNFWAKLESNPKLLKSVYCTFQHVQSVKTFCSFT